VVIEIFYTLKVGLIYGNVFEIRMHVRHCIFEYVAVFYSWIRTHSATGYNSPEEYEKQRKVAYLCVRKKRGKIERVSDENGTLSEKLPGFLVKYSEKMGI
jgi:hypothetical protein